MRHACKNGVKSSRWSAVSRTRTDIPDNRVGWPQTKTGLRLQQQRYQRAADVLHARQAANAQRRPCDRKPDDKTW